LLAFFELVAIVLIAVGSPSITSVVVGLTVATAIPLAIGTWAQLGARRVWNQVGVRTISFGRARPFPASAVREVRPLSDRTDIDREVARTGPAGEAP
jgi:hypothetical protein